MNVIGGRFIVRKTNIPNKIPTISAYDKHTSGKWIDTDIYQGELYLNVFDNRMWFRNSTEQVIEIPVLNTADLKIDKKYLPNLVGSMVYSGTWDASYTKYPELQEKGNYFIIDKNGIISGINYFIGDFIIFDGENWDKIDNTQKLFNSSNVIYDKNNKNLNQIIEELYDNSISDNIIVKDNGKDIFKLNNETLSYKNNSIYHNGNANNPYSDWVSNTLVSNTIKTESITSKQIESGVISSNHLKTNSIVNSNLIETNSLFIKDGKIKLNDNNIYIQGNGKGLFINHLSNNILEYNSFNNIFNSNVKIKYNNEFNFDNELDIVNKKYVDDEINKTLNIDFIENMNNVCRIKKNIKYINIDIQDNAELILDEFENNSQLITICVESLNDTFNLLITYKNNNVYNIIKSCIILLYFNSKNKKWYKLS